ncbi:hypothetical protein OIDMADRAFT_83429, partial [Oidiodendron maius Zn]
TLLSPTAYDDDVSSVHSVERSDQDTDSEDDDVLQGARTSAEIRAHDHRVLLDEEEQDRLLEESRQQRRRGSALAPLKKLFGRDQGETGESAVFEEAEEGGERKKNRRERRVKKKEELLEKANRGEDGRLMYEMEEGGMKEGSDTGSSSETEGSDELDRQGLRRLHSENLDGFRADFLNRGLTPRLKAFIEEGVSPPYMYPSFPSVTFPNHYTMATGLYPESHGVVGNTFWDPNLTEEFYYTHSSAMQSKWWGGEPIWVTAEDYGIRSAVHMWPGSEAHVMDMEPTYLDRYNGNEPLPNKVARMLELLDKPGDESNVEDVYKRRPQFIAAYVPNVDSDGHKFGPNSTEIRKTISDVDNMLDQLFQGLEARNLTKIVNVVVVSDHGMATTDSSRLIQLEDIVDRSLIAHTDGWPLYGLRPTHPSHLQELYDSLAGKASTNPNFDVYLRDKDMPERYHFSKNERIAPLWIVPKAGWAIVTKEEFNVADGKKQGLVYHPRGLHGYDHEHPLMRAIFVARGPAFPHQGNSRLEPFQNTEIYNIICDSLGLPPKPNNGTLRLPLRPVGLHTPESTPSDPQDPASSYSTAATAVTSNTSAPASNLIISISPVEASSAADPNDIPPTLVGVDNPGTGVDRPTITDDGAVPEAKSFWDWITAKLDGIKDWFS